MLQILKLRKSNRKRGFTLIEMIVVVAIIAILIALLVPNVMKFVDTANATAEKAAAKMVYAAAQAYSVDCLLGKNPDEVADGEVKGGNFAEYISDTSKIDMSVGIGATIAYFDDSILQGIKCVLRNGKTVYYPPSFRP